jgi:hypothetical protein
MYSRAADPSDAKKLSDLQPYHPDLDWSEMINFAHE